MRSSEINIESFIQAFPSALENENIVQKLKSVNSEFHGEVAKTLSTLSGSLSKIQEHIKSLEHKVKQLENDYDNLEQYTRHNLLRIYGIPENSQNEDIYNTVFLLLNDRIGLQRQITASDIDRAHRVSRVNTGSRPILV